MCPLQKKKFDDHALFDLETTAYEVMRTINCAS